MRLKKKRYGSATNVLHKGSDSAYSISFVSCIHQNYKVMRRDLECNN